MAKNLLQELAELNSTAPIDFDPEHQGLEENSLVGVKGTRRISRLNEDPKYQGSKTSRASLQSNAYNDDGDEPMGYKAGLDSDGSEPDFEGDNDDSESSDEDGNADSEHDEESLSQFTSNKLTKDLEAMEQEEETVLKTLSQDTSAQQRKGVHARHQLELWEATLESRIRLQKVLGPVNRLPLPDNYDTLMVDFDSELHDCISSLTEVASELLQLQRSLLAQNELTEDAVPDTLALPSLEVDDGQPPTKRAALLEAALETDVSAMEQGLADYQERTIDKWNQKTRLASGRASKGFKALDKSVLQQIKEALAQPSRLVQRTQIKRFEDSIVGYEPEAQTETEPKQDPLLEDVDEKDLPPEALVQTQRQRAQTQEEVPDIFDDTDYYHELLRELIDRKNASDTMDLTEMGRHFIQIDRLRAKNKRKVDTRASKGRKVRYDVHQKLVNIMAPNEQVYAATDNARDTLFRSLFGQ